MEFTPRPSQSEILKYAQGKMGISAVPGSGKTHTLSALAARLVSSGALATDQEVLIVTLVNTAVDNFTQRIGSFIEARGLIPQLGYRVRTLHGLAHDIVREKPSAVGLEDRFAILDERESNFIRSEAIQAWLQVHPHDLDDYLDPGLDENKREYVRHQELSKILRDVSLAFIRSAKDRRLSPAAMRNLLDHQPAPLPLAELGWEIYTSYQRALAYRGAVDFDDLISLALDLLEANPEYLERLRYRWPFILEDEAQDSSLLQEQILRLLSGEDGNWVRVGDPNQAIFETFTTASPRFLLRFIHEEASEHKELPDSGRSQPAIMSMANYLIDWVMEGFPEASARDALTLPHIRPTPPGDPQPNPANDPEGVKLIGHKYTPEEEVEAVVKSLENWLGNHPEGTVAVLVPRNLRGVDVIEALKRRKIAYIEFLASSSSTREAASSLNTTMDYLADPTSAVKLSRAYKVWQHARLRREGKETEKDPLSEQIGGIVRKCPRVESLINPGPDQDWLADLQGCEPEEVLTCLQSFRADVQRWQGTTLLPIDQMVLTLAQELFSEPADLALAHKLALVLRQVSNDHSGWRLPELSSELGVIARNERRFLGFSEDDSGFDPERHKGKVVVTTMHKAKGLEWDRVHLISVNNYDFPSNQPNDSYIAEKWFLRDKLNLQAEALAQLEALEETSEYRWYHEGQASLSARVDYVRERIRLLYVGITRAKKELVITWNTGRNGQQTQALAFAQLQGWWQGSGNE